MYNVVQFYRYSATRYSLQNVVKNFNRFSVQKILITLDLENSHACLVSLYSETLNNEYIGRIYQMSS